jgi:secreted Zn-dependent insulinase-like peptidase
LRSKTFEATGECTSEDRYFGTKYVKAPYPASLLEAMKNPAKLIQPEAKLGLPPVNPLLPKNLELVPADPEYAQVPKLVQEWESDTEVWYMKDDKFERPKAIINVKVYSGKGLLQELGITAEGRMLAEVWIAAIKEYLREFKYMAEMANLELEFTISNDAITLEFSGFNDSLTEFTDQILRRINEFRNLNKDDMQAIFNQVKEKLMQDWYNFYFE